jgi:hypothetical protein
MRLSISILVFTIFFTVGCDAGSPEQHRPPGTAVAAGEFSVTGVNDYEFTFNDVDAGGTINFSSAKLKLCSLVFIKSKFTKGYTTRTDKLGKGDIDLTCLTDDDHYALNESGSTYAQMTVADLNDVAVVKLDFSLFSVKSGTALTKKGVVLVVNAQQLKKLLVRK